MKHIQLKLNDDEYQFLLKKMGEESEKVKIKLNIQTYLRLILLRQDEGRDEG